MVFRTFGVDHSIRGRKDISSTIRLLDKRDFMVIRHNHSHPKFFGQTDCIRSSNPVVTGQDDFHSVFPGFADGVLMKPVTVFNTVRNELVTFCMKPDQTLVEDVSTGYSINIVIAYDADMLSGCYCILDDADTLFHIRQF